MPLISICMPLYNYAQFVPAAIESVLSQNWDELELVIVDDGSTDGSFQIAQEYAAKDSRVRVYTHTGHVNRGASPTLNAAYHTAKGAYLASLSADDVLLPESLEQRVTPLQNAQAAGFSYCRYS